jgi:hypothetical protein
MLKEFKADLHIHTCLSPCADLEMTPSKIVNTAKQRGIDIIAITDHNSAENVDAACKAALKTGITVLAGMEVTSSEEVHILALFKNIEKVMKLQELVYNNLLKFDIPASSRSSLKEGKWAMEQVVVNENDEVLRFNNRLLISSTTLNTYEIVENTHRLGGISIASHIDRDAFGILSQLGFIPDDLNLDAVEMSPSINRKTAEELYSAYTSIPWTTSSDAHFLKDIGIKTTVFLIKEPTIEEIASALKNIDGRKVEWE